MEDLLETQRKELFARMSELEKSLQSKYTSAARAVQELAKCGELFALGSADEDPRDSPVCRGPLAPRASRVGSHAAAAKTHSSTELN